MTRAGRFRNHPAVHEAASWLRFVGLRDRLRCPNCRAVGTWKPHGCWGAGDLEPRPRRWLCKWCGYFESARDGIQWCAPDQVAQVWKYHQDIEPPQRPTTPEAAIQRALGRTWPWKG